MAKDPQQVIGSIPLPYVAFDLGVLHDIFEWMGLGSSFTAFKGRGWGFLMVGSMMLMVGALAIRFPGGNRGMSQEILPFAFKAVLFVGTVYLSFIGIRVGSAGIALERARESGDAANYEGALVRMARAEWLMPCLKFDTGMIIQRGLYELRTGSRTPRARYYEALVLESGGFRARAESVYAQLVLEENEPVRRAAFRALFRLGIGDFNSGQEVEASRHTGALLAEFPVLPKAQYLRLLLAVRLGESVVARAAQRDLYAIGSGIGLPEKRSYLSSSHQHLGDLFYSEGKYKEAWNQFILRSTLE